MFGESKGNQATFDNSQRNNLRSCVWGFGGSVGGDVRAVLSSLSGRETSLISASVRVRSDDLDRSFSRGNGVPSERCGWVGRGFLRGVCASEGTWVDSLVIVGV